MKSNREVAMHESVAMVYEKRAAAHLADEQEGVWIRDWRLYGKQRRRAVAKKLRMTLAHRSIVERVAAVLKVYEWQD
jgi:hypothetical protein